MKLLKYRVTKAKHDLVDTVITDVVIPWVPFLNPDFSNMVFVTEYGSKVPYYICFMQPQDYAVVALKIPYMPNHGGFIWVETGVWNADWNDVFDEHIGIDTKMAYDHYYGDEDSIPDLVDFPRQNFATVESPLVEKTEEGYKCNGAQPGIVAPAVDRYNMGTSDLTLVSICRTPKGSIANCYLFKKDDSGLRYYMGLINHSGHLLTYLDAGNGTRRCTCENNYYDGERHGFVARFDRSDILSAFVNDIGQCCVVSIRDDETVDVSNDSTTIIASGGMTWETSVILPIATSDVRYIAERMLESHIYVDSQGWLFLYKNRDPWKPKLELEEEMQTRFLFGEGTMPAGLDWESEVWNITISSPSFSPRKVVVVEMESGSTAPTEPMTITVWGGISENRLAPIRTITGPTEANQTVGEAVEVDRAIKYLKVTAHGASDQDTPAFAEGAIA